MINVVIGRLGSYKTFYAVLAAKAIQLYMPSKAIYSNLHIDGCKMVESFDDIRNLNDAVLVLDEAQMFMNSRNYSSKENKALAEFGLISRKQGLEIFFILPRLGSLDINIREITDFFHYNYLEGDYVIHEVYENHMMSEELALYGRNKIPKELFKQFYGLFDTREKPLNFMRGAVL